MKKTILIVMVLLPLLFLLSSCNAGVSQEEYDSLASDLTAAQGQIQSLQEQLAQGKARVEILNAIFIPSITGELFLMTEAESIAFFLEWRDSVITIGDHELTSKFEAMISTFSDQALTEFFVYLLESAYDALE